MREVDARQLWQRILETRLQTGEPYLLFIDTVNRALPKHQRELGLKVSTSNLCSEITLPTGIDHRGEERTAVCCLSSLNFETWDEWDDEPRFIEDVMRFLDNVLTAFHRRRARTRMARAALFRHARALRRPRRHGLPLLPAGARHSVRKRDGQVVEHEDVPRNPRARPTPRRSLLAEERGACPDAAERGMKARFSHKLAIAPTASISIICGGTSACIEPIPANIYTHKTLSGAFSVRNPHLEKLLAEKGARQGGDLAVDPRARRLGAASRLPERATKRRCSAPRSRSTSAGSIELAADRTPFICQSQSLNLFLPADVDKWDLHMLHWTAWERGVKSLYYCRSKSVSRAGFAGRVEKSPRCAERCRYPYRLRGVPGMSVTAAPLSPTSIRARSSARAASAC